jgi:hypothetical protein
MHLRAVNSRVEKWKAGISFIREESVCILVLHANAAKESGLCNVSYYSNKCKRCRMNNATFHYPYTGQTPEGYNAMQCDTPTKKAP